MTEPQETQENYNSFPSRNVMMEKDKESEFTEGRGGGKGEPGVPPKTNMTEPQEIINPNFNAKTCSLKEGQNMVQCNKSSAVYKFIKTGKKYVIELPDTKTILNVECTFAAIRAADMQIITAFVDGKRDHDSEDCTFSYQYENFASVHYSSFKHREKCIVYISVDDLF